MKQLEDGTWASRSYLRKKNAKELGINIREEDAKIQHVGKSWWNGPYYKIKTDGRLAHKTALVSTREEMLRSHFDIDKTRDYREQRPLPDLIDSSSLTPLPFTPPTIWSFASDIFFGVVELALYMLVMLVAIMLEAGARDFRAGEDYRSSWLKLYKVCVVVYPASIMLVQALITAEYTLRRFMWYRLLSMRVMVDMEKPAFYNTWFAVLFFALYIIMNVWAFYGVVVWWGRNGQPGPERLSLAVLGVVNMSAIALAAAYRRLLTSEAKMLTPLQAVCLPPMWVVPESALRAECWRCMRAVWFMCLGSGPPRFDIEWLKTQAVWSPPADAAEWLTWQSPYAAAAGIAIPPELLAAAAAAKRAKRGAGSQGGGGEEFDDAASFRSALSAASLPSLAGYEGRRASADGAGLARTNSTGAAPAGGSAAVTLAPVPAPQPARDGGEAAKGVSFAGVAEGDAEAQADAATPKGANQKPMYIDPGYSDTPLHKRSKCWACVCWAYSSLCCCVQCMRVVSPQNSGAGFYALVNTWVCSASIYTVWPFRPDRKYLAWLMGAVALSLCVVAAVTGYGIWLAVGITPGRCQAGANACEDCYQYQVEYVQRDGACPNEGYTIEKPFLDYRCNATGADSPSCPYTTCTFYGAPIFARPEDANVTAVGQFQLQNAAGADFDFRRHLSRAYLMGVLAAYAYPTNFKHLLRGMEEQYELRMAAMFGPLGLSNWSYVYVNPGQEYDTQAVVARALSGDIFISFRGTDSVSDALFTDAASRQVPVPQLKGAPGADEIRVHNGFLSSYTEVHPRVLAALAALDPEHFTNLPPPMWDEGVASARNASGPRVWITGHSLGGALSVLSALGLRQRGVNVAGVYTLGSPRVGNLAFQAAYAQSGLEAVTWRIQHNDDVITQVPNEILGYRHVGQRMVCKDGKCEKYDDERCVHKFITGKACIISTSDHMTDGYLGQLRAALQASNVLPQCVLDRMPLGTIKDHSRRV